MLTDRAREVMSTGDGLFSSRGPLLSLWQAIAENFYTDRADFTSTRNIGDEFAIDVMSSYPHLVRRELGNLFASHLRPRAAPWFRLKASDERLDKDNQARGWMEYASAVQWRAMYDSNSQFVRATKEADHDFAAFGNAVIEGRTNTERDGLLYLTYHLRDSAWSENQNGKVDSMYIKWKPTARQLKKLFPSKVHKLVNDAAEKEPERHFNCKRIVVPSELYDLGKGNRLPFSSVYIDEENETVLEEVPLGWFPFVVPRWQTVSGTQYARSMATDITLPDGRTLQTMTRVLLEAGEKAVDPPMIATQDVIRSDFGLYAGGVTWVDQEYDEKMGDALRPLNIDSAGIPLGMEMANQIRSDLREGFFLNKLGLPEANMKTMTAYEVGKRIQENIRAASPVFEPVEDEYNSPLCNLTFDILRANGAFGPVESIPEVLRGKDVGFNFDSPLREIADEMKGQTLLQGLEILKATAEIDPAQVANARLTAATRDALRGIKWPAEWLEDEGAVDSMRADMAKKAQAQEAAATLDAGTKIAGQAGVAGQELEAAGIA
jgi:hypothetical protein